MPIPLSRAHWTTVVTSLVLLAGCTGGSSGPGQLEQTTITVDAFGAIDTAGLFIAEQDGLFAAQGLKVNLRMQILVQPQVDDLLSGKADIASGDYVTFIDNETSGDPDLGNRKPDLRIISESSFSARLRGRRSPSSHRATSGTSWSTRCSRRTASRSPMSIFLMSRSPISERHSANGRWWRPSRPSRSSPSWPRAGCRS